MGDFDVPLYDGDLEKAQGIPAGAQELPRRLLASDAFILASPEYNASMPGSLSNLKMAVPVEVAASRAA